MVPSKVQLPATEGTSPGASVVVVTPGTVVVVIDVEVVDCPGTVVGVVVSSPGPLVGRPSAQAATPSRRHSRRMAVRHFRSGLPFAGQVLETSGLHAARHLRSGVLASAIAPTSTTATNTETRRPMGFLPASWDAGRPAAVSSADADALRAYTTPAARRRASSSPPMPISPSSASVSAPSAAPGA